MTQLIQELFMVELDNVWLAQGDDAARLPACGGLPVMATDAHVVKPLFFPGGDIGCLSVHGSINDVAMLGARPLYLAASFILEEGLPLADLHRIVRSMAQASRTAGVPIVTADTKVVERGNGDGVFITTTAFGVVAPERHLSGAHARSGDVLLISGPVGEHGMAIMVARENLNLVTGIMSDTAALHGLVERLLERVPEVRTLRDPTRGGLAATTNEIARQSGVGLVLDEAAIPVRPEVAAACELLGLDVLNLANEGRLLAACPAAHAGEALAALRSHPLGEQAAIIGEVVDDPHCFVRMRTRLGGQRMVDWLAGDPLPRIC